MNNKFKLFGKISIVDICAVILLIGGVLFALDFSEPTTISGSGDVKVRYTIEILEKKPEFLKHVVINEKIFDILKGYELGVLTEYYTKPSFRSVADLEGEVIRSAKMPGVENLYLVIESQAQVTPLATSIGQYDIMVGKKVYVKTKDFAGEGFIVELEREGENAN